MPRLIDENGNEISVDDDLDTAETETEATDETENEEGENEVAEDEGDGDAEDGQEGDGEEESDDEGQIVLEIDGEAVDDDDDDPDLVDAEDDSATIRKMRARLRDEKRRNRELARQMEQATQSEQQELGERPTLDQFDYDEEAYAEALASYLDRKKEADQKAAAEQERAERLNKAFEAKKAAYEVNKAKLNAPDFENAEAAIKDTFTPVAQGVMLSAAKEPERVVYALGKSPALREALAKLQDDPIAMAAEIGRMESRIQLKPRKPATKPERRVKGSASTGKTPAARDFERALESNNGDMTAAFNLYKQRARAG